MRSADKEKTEYFSPPLFSAPEYLLIALCFLTAFYGALVFPAELCPDEQTRSVLIDFMVKYGKLPTGDEIESLMYPAGGVLPYGFSYAIRPFFPAMVGAVLTRIAMLFTNSPVILRLASRLFSVCCLTGCCVTCLLTGRLLFQKRSSAVLFAVIICFQPQVMFLGMYHNNDIPSLFAVCLMLYCLADGYVKKWPVQSCTGIGLSFSLGLLTYYSIFGWFLMGTAFCILSVLTDPEIRDKGRLIFRRSAWIAGMCLVLAGWFYIRSALIHNGDFLGIAYEEVTRQRLAGMGYTLLDYVNSRRDGMTPLQFFCWKNYEWLWMSSRSFIGTFGNMTIYLPLVRYGIYYSIHAAGILLFSAVIVRRKPSRFDVLYLITLLVSSVITVGLHFWHSYARDFQPQGRYVITLVTLFSYLLSYGLDKTELTVRGNGGGTDVRLDPASAICWVWLLLFIRSFFDSMLQMTV